MIGLKQIFTWWNRNTFGTFLKTLLSGKYVGKDELGNKYYKSKKDERWVIYKSDIEATKITSDWFLWIHHTINDIPASSTKKYSWQKNHTQNLSGSSQAYKPNKISKKNKFVIHYEWEGSLTESGQIYSFKAIEIIKTSSRNNKIVSIEAVWTEKQFIDQFR